MVPFEIMYLIFGGHLVLSGVSMVVAYSLSYPWWREHLGRMLVTYAVAEILMSVLLLVTVVGHVSPHWFRAVWFALQVIVSGTFWFQFATIIRLRRQRLSRERTET